MPHKPALGTTASGTACGDARADRAGGPTRPTGDRLRDGVTSPRGLVLVRRACRRRDDGAGDETGVVGEQVAAQELEARYRCYNAVCNAHRFERLARLSRRTLRSTARSRAWRLTSAGSRRSPEPSRLPVGPTAPVSCRVAGYPAHFVDTGTRAGAFLGVAVTGRNVRTQEFAVYRLRRGPDRASVGDGARP